jgi:ABC-2 type transport system ATP-binding protein
VSEVESVPGVPGGWRITVVGSPGPLLQRLAACDVERLRTVEPSLEEIFLTYYA